MHLADLPLPHDSSYTTPQTPSATHSPPSDPEARPHPHLAAPPRCPIVVRRRCVEVDRGTSRLVPEEAVAPRILVVVTWNVSALQNADYIRGRCTLLRRNHVPFPYLVRDRGSRLCPVVRHIREGTLPCRQTAAVDLQGLAVPENTSAWDPIVLPVSLLPGVMAFSVVFESPVHTLLAVPRKTKGRHTRQVRPEVRYHRCRDSCIRCWQQEGDCTSLPS